MSKDFKKGTKYPKEKEGSRYIVVKDGDDFEVGTIVVLVENDESHCPFFSMVHKSGEVSNSAEYLFWKSLQRLEIKKKIGGKIV